MNPRRAEAVGDGLRIAPDRWFGCAVNGCTDPPAGVLGGQIVFGHARELPLCRGHLAMLWGRSVTWEMPPEQQASWEDAKRDALAMLRRLTA